MSEKIYIYDGKTYSKTEIEPLVKVDEKNSQRISERGFYTLKMVEGKNILDIGCSTGSLSKCLALSGKKVHGIDVLETAIEIAKDFNYDPNIIYEVRDFLKQPFPENSFDCILFTETIEHVDNPAQYLKEFYRILKPEGYLILSTPNATSLKNIMYALSYRKKEKRQKISKEISQEPKRTGTQLEHIYNWDFPTLVRLLDRCGFGIADHMFMRSGPIVIPFFGRKIQVIKTESEILRRFEPLMANMIIKARKL